MITVNPAIEPQTAHLLIPHNRIINEGIIDYAYLQLALCAEIHAFSVVVVLDCCDVSMTVFTHTCCMLMHQHRPEHHSVIASLCVYLQERMADEGE